MIDRDEGCMVGFIKSCDYDNQKGISIREWNTCFPPLAAGEYIRVKCGEIVNRCGCLARFPVQFLLVNHEIIANINFDGWLLFSFEISLISTLLIYIYHTRLDKELEFSMSESS